MNIFNNEGAQKMLAEVESQKIFSQKQKKKKEALARVRCEAIFEQNKERVFKKIEKSIQKSCRKGHLYSKTYVKAPWKCWFSRHAYFDVASEKIAKEFRDRGFAVSSYVTYLSTDESSILYDLSIDITVI